MKHLWKFLFTFSMCILLFISASNTQETTNLDLERLNVFYSSPGTRIPFSRKALKIDYHGPLKVNQKIFDLKILIHEKSGVNQLSVVNNDAPPELLDSTDKSVLTARIVLKPGYNRIRISGRDRNNSDQESGITIEYNPVLSIDPQNPVTIFQKEFNFECRTEDPDLKSLQCVIDGAKETRQVLSRLDNIFKGHVSFNHPGKHQIVVTTNGYGNDHALNYECVTFDITIKEYPVRPKLFMLSKSENSPGADLSEVEIIDEASPKKIHLESWKLHQVKELTDKNGNRYSFKLIEVHKGAVTASDYCILEGLTPPLTDRLKLFLENEKYLVIPDEK